MTIFASGELGWLQMVSELDIGRCASEEAGSQRGVDTRQCANKDTGPRRGQIGVGSPTSIKEGNECQQGCWP